MSLLSSAARDMLPTILDIATLSVDYRNGRLTPLDVVESVLARIAAYPDRSVWISRLPDDEIRANAATLLQSGGRSADQPLWGIPFAVKDNIDCVGLDTTAGCPAFAYRPSSDARVVARLKAAGAILVGKTNLDQFATGLNGTRSPYGAPRSVFDSRYISGGSSSGSAVAVASGQVAFALGTDTAGSGRVPAAFNNLVGVKPTRGLLSTVGLVPACRSLDCIAVLAATVGDADLVRRTAQGFDAADLYSRHAGSPRSIPSQSFRFGILGALEREFFGDAETAALYDAAIARLTAIGGAAIEIEYAPFRDCARLLYGGPWVAERLAAIDKFFEAHAVEMDPTVRGIIGSARSMTAVDAFNGAYALEEFRRTTDSTWATVDVLMLPTAPTIYTVEAMMADPVRLNGNLGHYTNFVNLLDCCAVAIPAGFRSDGLPAGVTLVAQAFADDALAVLADQLHRIQPFGMGAERDALPPAGSALTARGDGELVSIVVVGAHLSGMPLNHQLVDSGGLLLRCSRTTPDYRMFVLPEANPPKPGLIRAPGFVGPGLEVEVWGLPPAAFGRFVAAIPAPLGVGKVTLVDGGSASGFLCEAHAVEGAKEITALGSWRRYVLDRA
jgi:allophanate hydrolase